jgi:hypothetical protein
MRQSKVLTAALAALFLTACGSADVVVTAEVQVQDPASGQLVARSLSNLQVQLLPYDRDFVFDSLSRAAATPEPEIPADLLRAQAEIAAAQQAWREAESRWNVLRDTLQKLNAEMARYSPAEAAYRLLFADYQPLEGEYNRVESQVDQLFVRFDSLQKASIQREQEVRLMREAWADEAFADASTIFRERLRASKLPLVVDTTDVGGLARFAGLKPGQYWVHARLDQPYTELYWNVPVTVEKGEPIQVHLTRENAQERPRI